MKTIVRRFSSERECIFDYCYELPDRFRMIQESEASPAVQSRNYVDPPALHFETKVTSPMQSHTDIDLGDEISHEKQNKEEQ